MTRYSKLWIVAFSLLATAFAGCTNDEDLGARSPAADGGASSGDGSNPANDPDSSTNSMADGGADGPKDEKDGASVDTSKRKVVFVTSFRVYGDVAPSTIPGDTAVQQADALCNQAASAAGLSGNFKSYLSRAGNGDGFDAPAPANVVGNGPWYLTNRTTLAFLNRASLSTSPMVPILQTEYEAELTSDFGVWTGTSNGTATSHLCNSWTNMASTKTGTVGSASSTSQWSDVGTSSCDSQNRFYCFQQ